MRGPRLIWDCGTAYDLFVSLLVLHKPSKYELRGAWAKGVRARLPTLEREILEQATTLIWPFHWLYTLPEPKDGATALQVLEQMSPSERLPALVSFKIHPEVMKALQGVAERESWNKNDLAELRAAYKGAGMTAPKKAELTDTLKWWSRSREFGERYLEALRHYYEVFFAEEEVRIRPALEKALARAQQLATRLDLSALVEELSQGLRLAELPEVPELVLAPSFWSTPLLIFARVNPECELILFGARPADASLVPGEIVPDALMRALKALGDPTRLRILRYLAREPLTPTQLAHRLRLRAPTVVHHLHRLRMAELVHLTLEAGDKGRYAARPEAIEAAFAALGTFLETENASGERMR